MTGRNNKPDNDGSASNPSRLDQFGDKLSSHNEEEFRSAVDLNTEQNCEVEEQENQ
ncbi:MAG: hypothetical protein ACE3L7_00255 [Candidatus Pristimantibacillus sp.]|uniref:YfhD family protein n=1 Tax=Paenibacillus baimaensis TaxID=2982185 RepID=A0ABT2UDB6_9BACL|nr:MULTISPECIES: hypothetical protein [unclassified Paenibacillus]MCU6792111.1 hypothetical protein [Paenibacillus sp. WQ 127069]